MKLRADHLLYFIVLFILVSLVMYLLYVSLLPFGTRTVYTIDIGGDDLRGAAKLTGPMDRISVQQEANGRTYRNLTHSLVYFELTSPYLKKREGDVSLTVVFKDIFPEGQKFMVGARNNESWSYAWKDLYVPFYESLRRYPSVQLGGKCVYILNGDGDACALTQLTDIPEGSVIATDTKLDLNRYVECVERTDAGVSESGSENLSVRVALRGGHTFYTYVEDGALALRISKQDLNWYNGSDELKLEVYSAGDTLVGSGSIPDDGVQTKTNVLGPVQEASFSFSDLANGVYRLTMIAGDDLLIRAIELDKSKLVVDGRRLFVAGNNPAYFKNETAAPVALYFRNSGKSSVMRFQTYHVPGLQNITIKNEFEERVELNRTHEVFNLSLGPAEELRTLVAEKGDLLIESLIYFAFTEDSWFMPERVRVIDLKPDMEWLTANVDYVILEYTFPEPEGGEWKAGRVRWHFDADELYLKGDTLSFVLNVPHLGKDEFRNYTIPVDRVDVEVRIPPLWERI